jgi:hypothetical protein
MIRDEKHIITIVIKRDGNEGTIKIHNKIRKMIINVNANLKNYTGFSEIIFLSKNCDPLILGESSVKYIRKN